MVANNRAQPPEKKMGLRSAGRISLAPHLHIKIFPGVFQAWGILDVSVLHGVRMHIFKE